MAGELPSSIPQTEGPQDREKREQELDGLYREARGLYRQWVDLVKQVDDLEKALPYSFWENEARGLPNKEVVDDPKNADTMRPVIETKEAIKKNIAEREEIYRKIAEIESSAE